MDFTFLNVAFPFEAGLLDRVDAVLSAEGQETQANGRIWQALSGKGVHFTSITTIPADPGEKAWLFIESSHDGDKAGAIRVLAQELGDSLRTILESADIAIPDNDLATLLEKRSIDTGTGLFSIPGVNHRGAPGVTVERIVAEEQFADAVRKLVADDRREGSALTRLKAIREQIRSEEGAEAMLRAEDVSFLRPSDAPEGFGYLPGLVLRGLVNFAWPVLLAALGLTLVVVIWAWTTGGIWDAIGMAAVSVLVWLGILIAGLGLLYAGLRRKEQTDEPDDSTPDYTVLSDVMQLEDAGNINHLAGISRMKPGKLRVLTLKIAFWFVGEMAATRFRPGFLGELGTIHSARWVLLPNTDKLLFFSNYGGSWESYLEDFITKAASGLTAVWSNTEGYPRTSNLFFEGARDGDRFKRWARRQQRPTRFWYRAYPLLKTSTVRLNAAIRHGLITAATEDEAVAWFDLFGSRQRRANSLDAPEIQKIAFGGMRRLRDGVCILVRLPEDPASARRWLRELAPQVSFGDDKPHEDALILAFTACGLQRLGLGEAEMAGFPAVFRQGMDEMRRARAVLKDTGEDSPEEWLWGHGDRSVDAALYLLSEVPDGAEENAARQKAAPIRAALEDAGGAVVSAVETERMPASGPVREPFGFVDGVSQPILRGTYRWPVNQASHDVVEPGEFILGYPDNRGFLPPVPTIPAAADGQNLLPARDAVAVNADWPDFRGDGAKAVRDFGRNGSYLVIRQLKQNVDLFHEQARDMANALADNPRMPPGLNPEQLARWIKAKAVGRWEDGSSLTRNPQAPASGWDGDKPAMPDNDFLHGVEDPEGMRCPFGSHIRRTNPRESFSPGDPVQLSIVDRHRILRVGRPYAVSDEGERGLLFMCLNADLERQFEFVQQTWSMAPQFHGLTDEIDAIIGNDAEIGTLTIPTAQGPVVASGFRDVVRMRGGAYFFMPGRSALRFLTGTA